VSVVVVGAGLAGLAAASELVRRGFDVTVLEASGRVGGRMTSDEIDGVVIDRGAQFLSSAYGHVLSLCRVASLESMLEETSPTRGAAPDRRGRDRVAQERVPRAHRRAARRHARRRRGGRAPEAA
jgi:oxygen-dependent protoporphyrinogen oxidase